MSDYENLPYVVIERPGGAPAAFLWGALLGAAAALLLAPRSGAATRTDIRDAAERLKSDAEDRVTGARDSVERRVQRVRDGIDERVATLRGNAETQAERAREAVEAGRRAAEETRVQLERRLASVKAQKSGAAVRGDPGERDATVVIEEVVVETEAGEIPLD